MNSKASLIAALGAVVVLSACSDSDGDPQTRVAIRDIPVGDADCLGGGRLSESGPDTNGNGTLDPGEVETTEILECAVTPTLRALHASPDAPKVNIWVDGTPALTEVDYNQGSGFLQVGQAANVNTDDVDVNVQVEGILPGDDAVVLDATLPLAFGTETTVIASGTIEGVGAAFGPILITNPIGEEIPAGSFRAQVVHAAPNAPDVDVYVTALGGALVDPVNGTTPLTFGADTGRLPVPAGDYQIRVAVPDPMGGAPTVVYDSGEVSIPEGADLLIAATENVFLGDSAVQLMVLDGTGAAPLYDAATPAAALAVHLGPDAPAVDILADVGSTAAAEAIKLVEHLEYTQSCVINPIAAPEDYTLSVVATGDTSSVLDIPYSAVVNEGTVAIVSGLISTGTLQAIALPVDARSVFTETKIRLTHGSPSTPAVDIYILPQGDMIGDPTAIVFEDVVFGQDTGILQADPAQNYDVYVTIANDTMPQISVTGLNPEPGQVLDVIARDAKASETGPQALLIDYDNLQDCVVTP